MIPCKSKRISDNTILKKTKKWGFRNFVYVGNSGMIYDFYIYTGKENTEFEGLQKCSAVVARLSEHLYNKSSHKLLFITLALLYYLKSKNLLAVGTITANRLLGCPL